MRRDIHGAPAGKPPPEGAKRPFHVVEHQPLRGNLKFALMDADGNVFEYGDHPTRGAAQTIATHYNEFDRGRLTTDLLMRPAGPGATIK